MNKIKLRSFIEMKFLEGKKAKVIYNELLDLLGIDCPSFKTICYWVNELQRDWQDLKDKPRSGRPTDAMTEEIVQNIAEAVKQDRHISTHFLVVTVNN